MKNEGLGVGEKELVFRGLLFFFSFFLQVMRHSVNSRELDCSVLKG